MDKNQREARRRQEDKALNRGLLWVVGAIVLECLLMFVNRYYINYYVYEVDFAILVLSVLKVLRIGGAVIGLLTLVWALLWFRKRQKAVLPTVLTLACWALAVCSHVTMTYQKSGMQMLLLLVPAWAVLALVYYLYQREFFLAAVAVGLASLGLWFVRYGGGVGVEVVLTLAGILLVAVIALCLKKSGGVIRRTGGEELRVIGKNASYGMILLSCLAGAAAVVAAILLGANAAYYLLFAMIAWLFALFVYHTAKLL